MLADHRFATTLVVFIVTYLALAAGRVPRLRTDRAGIAFIGAALVLAFGLLSISEAASPKSLDYETLFLLLGMMLVVGALRVSGFFDLVTRRVISHVHTPRMLLAVVVILAGLLSAFLVNDVVCVAMTPLVIHLARRMKTSPVPHLMALATAANVGSVGTITGNPQNMIIGVKSHITYMHFALRLMPVAIAGLVVCYGVLAVIYRKSLAEGAAPPAHADDNALAHLSHGPHRTMIYKSVAVTAVAVALFFAGFPLAIVASGAAAVTLLSGVRPKKLYEQVDWGLLLMFVGLFILVHAFQVHVVSAWDVSRWTWASDHPVTLLSAASAALSNVVSNVPAVLLFEPVLATMPVLKQQTAWLALAMSSTFAGNLTVLGSVANLIVVEGARREGVTITFWEYCKAGIPITLITLLLGVVWLCVT